MAKLSSESLGLLHFKNIGYSNFASTAAINFSCAKRSQSFKVRDFAVGVQRSYL